MQQIHLNTMVQVSNNSLLTKKLHAKLNEVLTDEQKADFNRWVQLVQQERDILISHSAHRGRSFRL
jgi:hypothetical protein